MNAPVAEKFTEETVLWVKRHTSKLMTFAITRPEGYRFSAGQFSRLGFRDGEGFIWRAYSIVSAEYDDTLEYFVVLIEDGPISAKFAVLEANDTILLDKNTTGFLLPERFADGKDLVMLSTGSGIAPFLSQLQQSDVYQRFERIALVHSVSHADELIFNERVASWREHPLVEDFQDKLTFVPVTTREQTEGALNARIPALLQSGELAAHLGWEFNTDHTRFMVCGNPEMVKDTFQALLDMGFAMHRNRIPGHIIMENGF